MTIGSVDGLISGMSTTDIINQLVSAEASGQTAIKNRVTAAQKTVTAMQSINTKLAALGTAADALTTYRAFAPSRPPPPPMPSRRRPAPARSPAASPSTSRTSPSPSCTPPTTPSPSPTSSPATRSPSARVDRHADRRPVTARLETVVAAINRPAPAYVPRRSRSRPVSTSLQLSSSTTGAVSDFSVTGLNVPESELAAGADAAAIGPTPGGYDVTSSTNTFSQRHARGSPSRRRRPRTPSPSTSPPTPPP